MKRMLFVLSATLVCAVAAGAAPQQTIRSLDASGLTKEIAAGKGKVVVVNLWATWCPPCRKEFPDFVKFYRTYRKKPLRLFAVSVDDPDTVDSRVKPFLKSNGVEFPVFFAQHADDEKFAAAISKDWQGEIPVTLVFDKKGRRRAFHVGMLSYKELEKMVKPLF